MRHGLAGAIVLAALAAGEAGAQPAPCTHWIATNGTDSTSTPGTSAQPWRTVDFASARLLALGLGGSVVCLKDGVYTGGNSLYERFATPTTFRAENAYRAVLQNSSRALSLFGARHLVFEGLEFRHTGAGAEALVIQVQMADLATWSEDVVFRNNILHDSWNNDILKINNGARRVTVEGNVFYNQAGSDEHMDVNSVTDVVVQDNIFFNDFEGSGRPNNNDTSSFIVMKDSNGLDDNQIGADRITVRRNVFLNWQGSGGSNFVLIGEDGNDYFEGEDILVENNLMIGNSGNDMRAAFGVKGGRNVTFRSNTVAGNLPALAYAFRINREGANPVNETIRFHNNIWSDPTGTMGAEAAGGTNDFSDGEANEVSGLVLDRNLYWNGGAAIPPGNQVNPNVTDTRRIVANPLLAANQAAIVLPRWTGTAFLSGNTTIRQEFLRLVEAYGAIPPGSPGHDQADVALSAADDIRGRPRSTPDVGAYEVSAPPVLSIADAAAPESGSAVFTVSLSAASPSAVTVSYATSPGSAGAGTDYTSASGLLTFAASATTRTVTVALTNDALDEPDETFTVTLSAPSGATIGDGQATGTIQDDDPTPVLDARDCNVIEGDTGSQPCVVNVSLAAPSGRTVAVGYATSNGSATAGSDYTAVTGTLTFAPGATARSVPVPVLGDTQQEGDETFAVVLSAPVNATVGDGIGTAFILDDDAPSPSSIELTHGSVLRADLAGGTADFYRIAQGPYASYEVVLDEAAGDSAPGLRLERLNTTSTAVTQNAVAIGTGSALSLRWQNSTFAAPLISEPLRVSAPSCGSACGADDTYRLRAFETTARVARFNNTGGQTTFLFVQNVGAVPVSGRIDFWSPTGTLIGSSALGPLAPRALRVLDTSTGFAGGGSITIANDGAYGALAGKAVSIEPATGFSFDSPLVYRPR